MRTPRDLFKATVTLGLLLAACGGGAAAPSSAPAPASVAAPKPSAAASAPASAKPAASAAASAKPAASAEAKPSASASVAPTATTLPAVAADEAQVTPTKFDIPPVAGKVASMDIMEISQANHMLYLADRTSGGVDVIDVSGATPKYVTTVKTSDTPNGITVADNVNKVFTGLTNSKIAIIDIDPKSPNVNKVITELDTGGKKRADESDYDPNTKKGMVANSDDQLVSIVDLVNNKITKKIDVPGGSIEQPRYNPGDKFMYMTGSEDNVYYQFDMVNETMVKKTPVDDKCTPNGNAINGTTGIALLGCSIRTNQHVATWDIKAGKTTATYANIGGCDGAIYDAKADAFFAGCNNYFRGPQLGIFNGKDGKWVINVAVKSSGAVAYDETNKIVYDRDAVEGALLYFPLPNLTTIAASSKPVAASAAAAASGSAAAKPAASGATAASGAASAKPAASGATGGAASAKPSV